MLTRLYVNNYRSLVNCEFTFQRLNFLLGPNGGGKSSVFDVLHAMRDFARGETDTIVAFPQQSFTRWISAKPPIQTFELDLKNELGAFRYHLAVEHNPEEKKCRVKKERLELDGKPLFASELGQAQLYRDDHSEGPKYPIDWSRSGVGSLMEYPDNKKLTRFKKELESLFIARPNPQAMDTISRKETALFLPSLSDFADWCRHLLYSDPVLIGELTLRFAEIMPGLHSLKFEPVGENEKLFGFRMGSSQNAVFYRFNELSDGQRMIIVLYTMLFGVPQGSVLCLDEPENYLALPEIQPWLDSLQDQTEQDKIQAMVISHHPKLINNLVHSNALWLDRPNANEPTRVRPVTLDPSEGGLSASTLVERGWIMDE